VPRHADAIRHNLALNDIGNVTVIEKAVADHRGGRLLVPPESTGARLDSRAVPAHGASVLDVEVVTLDDLVHSGVILPPDVVKIDVEGAELEVVRGMAQTLSRYRPTILCEMHGRNAEYARLLTALGYEVRTLDGHEVETAAPYAVSTETQPRGASSNS
jgi:FkbM family methyltransferase